MKREPQDQLLPESHTSGHAQSQKSSKAEHPRTSSRRAFLKGFGAATIATAVPAIAAAAHRVMPDVLSDTHSPKLNLDARRHQAYRKRLDAASEDRKKKPPPHPNNGDEVLYKNGIANFTKGFQHDPSGIVNSTVYTSYLGAIRSGKR